MSTRQLNGWLMQERGWWTKDRVGGVCNERGGWMAWPATEGVEPTRWPNMRAAMRACEEIMMQKGGAPSEDRGEP